MMTSGNSNPFAAWVVINLTYVGRHQPPHYPVASPATTVAVSTPGRGRLLHPAPVAGVEQVQPVARKAEAHRLLGAKVRPLGRHDDHQRRLLTCARQGQVDEQVAPQRLDDL